MKPIPSRNRNNNFYTHLQTRGVFACHCHIRGDHLLVGILVLDPEENLGDVVRLVNPKNKSEVFHVFLSEDMQADNYKVKLLLANDNN